MSSDKLVKYEVSIELYSHHTVHFSLKNILDEHYKVVPQYYGSIAQLNTHRISLKNCTVITSLQYYFLSRTDLNAYFELFACTDNRVLYF